MVRWISQSEVSKRSKDNVSSRLGPKLSVFSRLGTDASSSHVLSTSGPFTRNGKKRVIFKQIWVPKVKGKSPLDAPLRILSPPPSVLAVPASDKLESSPLCREASYQAKDCAAGPSILSYLEKTLHIGNTVIEDKEVEAQDSKASLSDSDSDSSSQDSDIDLNFDSLDPEEEGLLIQNLQQLDQELPEFDQESLDQYKSLCQQDKELEGVAELFEQRGGIEDEDLLTGLEVGVNPVKSTSGQILALSNSGSVPLSSSPYPSKSPLVDDHLPSISPSCVQNSLVFSGDKVECSSQGDSLSPLRCQICLHLCMS